MVSLFMIRHLPWCRTIGGQFTCMITGVGISGDGLSATGGDGEVASDGIISYYPEFTQFGDFRNCMHKKRQLLAIGFKV